MSSPALLALSAPDATSLAALADRAKQDGSRTVVDARRPPSSDPVDWIDGATAEAVAGALRAAGLSSSLSLWCEVPTAARVVALLRARSVLAGGGSVALLCGDLDGLLDAVSAPAALLRLIDGAEDPAWAALRDADGVVQRGLRSVVELLESEMTAAWIASSSEADAAHDIASCALAGIEVTRVEVTGGGAARDDLLPSGAPLRATTAGVEQVDGGFVLHVPLEPWAAERARVGRHRTDLVVDADGRRRRLALPPALQRCVAVDAVRAPSGLRVRFAPDPALWPAAASPSGESAA